MKRVKDLVGALTAVLLFSSAVTPLQAKKDDVTSATIKEMENQISKAEQEMKELKNSLSDVKGLVKQLEKEKTNLS